MLFCLRINITTGRILKKGIQGVLSLRLEISLRPLVSERHFSDFIYSKKFPRSLRCLLQTDGTEIGTIFGKESVTLPTAIGRMPPSYFRTAVNEEANSAFRVQFKRFAFNIWSTRRDVELRSRYSGSFASILTRSRIWPR